MVAAGLTRGPGRSRLPAGSLLCQPEEGGVGVVLYLLM